MKKIAIIGGSGKMGRWFANFFVKDGKEVIISGRNKAKLMEVKEQLGVEVATNIEAVKNADIVLLSVPIDNFEEVVKEISLYTRPEQVIMDITSIKVLPVEIMHKYLRTSLVLGTHPMFGPGAKSIAGQNFILTPTSDSEMTFAQKVKGYLENKGAKVILMTPQKHDEMMSIILGLPHFIALVSADTLLSLDNLKQTEAVGGVTYRALLTLVKSVISEDPEFYASLQISLPNVTEIQKLFQARARLWADLVRNKNKLKFEQRMNRLKNKLKKEVPDFESAYKNLYEIASL